MVLNPQNPPKTNKHPHRHTKQWAFKVEAELESQMCVDCGIPQEIHTLLTAGVTASGEGHIQSTPRVLISSISLFLYNRNFVLEAR